MSNLLKGAIAFLIFVEGPFKKRLINSIWSDVILFTTVSFKIKCEYLVTFRVATHSGNFQVEENFRETQGILIYVLNSGKF